MGEEMNTSNQLGLITVTITKENFSKLCRICLMKDGDINLFNSEYKGKSLSHVYEYVTLEKIEDHKYIPNKICKPCSTQLISSFTFLTNTRSIQRSMEKMLPILNIRTKINPEVLKLRTAFDEIVNGKFKEQQFSISKIPVKNNINEDLYRLLKNKKSKSSPSVESNKNSNKTIFNNAVSELKPLSDLSLPNELEEKIANNEDHSYCSNRRILKAESANHHGILQGNMCQSEIVKIMDKALNDQKISKETDSLVMKNKVITTMGRDCIRLPCAEIQHLKELVDHLEDPLGVPFNLVKNNFDVSSFDVIETSIESMDLWVRNDGTTVFERGLRRHPLKIPVPKTRCRIAITRLMKKPKKVQKVKISRSINRQIECFVCNEIFESQKALNQHKRESGHPTLLPKFQCVKCDMWFGRKENYRIHLKDRHPANKESEPGIICEVCGLKLKFRSNYKRHLLTHTDLKPYTCTICQVSYARLEQLKYHNKKKHRAQSEEQHSLVCYICGLTIGKSMKLNVHIRKYHSEFATHPCDICDQRFLTSTAVHLHRRKHDNRSDKSENIDTGSIQRKPNDGQKKPKPMVECEICRKKVRHLEMHMDIHRDIKRYQCTYCLKSFRQNAHLMSHKRLHTNDKPFRCDMCDKSFRHQTTLVVHRRSHTGETPYVCRYCFKGFAHQSTMTKHERRHEMIKTNQYSVMSHCTSEYECSVSYSDSYVDQNSSD